MRRLSTADPVDLGDARPVGGAQAVAGLAYGTATIAPVDRIVGPGNAYVAEAKRQVYGRVGIDGIAGPSEVVVVADARNNPAHVAMDLLAQAEHDPSSQSILVTTDGTFADNVVAALRAALLTLPRAEIARASWDLHGAIVIVTDWAEAAELINRLAPEHLQIMIDAPEAFFARIRHAGAAFLGRDLPEAIGDYIAGPNHVLPTGRTSRFASGLSVFDFLKRTTWVAGDAAALAAVGPSAIRLAEAEGLGAHAMSIALRLGI
jgi:histidinol dehydrogenase